MIDMTSHRDPIYQFETLKKELKNYSEKLASRKYTIALTKIDSAPKEKIEEFFEKLNIKPTEPKYKASPEYPCYFDENTFILPISAVSNINIESLKYALMNLVESVKNEDSI
jgi:GTP-binding protein